MQRFKDFISITGYAGDGGDAEILGEVGGDDDGGNVGDGGDVEYQSELSEGARGNNPH